MTANSDEAHRHRCEVRQILRWRAERGAKWVRVLLDDIAARRGQAAADRIRLDCERAWSKGERGQE